MKFEIYLRFEIRHFLEICHLIFDFYCDIVQLTNGLMKKGNRLTIYILIAMVLGVIVGYIVHTNSSPEFIKKFSSNIKLLTTIFLRLVQMIIAPLVFSTLVVGIAKLGDLKTVGRVG